MHMYQHTWQHVFGYTLSQLMIHMYRLGDGWPTVLSLSLSATKPKYLTQASEWQIQISRCKHESFTGKIHEIFFFFFSEPYNSKHVIFNIES